MSGCLEIHRELFGKFATQAMGDYQRSPERAMEELEETLETN